MKALTFTTNSTTDLPHGHEYVTRTFNIDWSFGMCLTKDLNALHRLAWAYLAPAYLLSMVLLSYRLSRFYRFHRIFCRSTCIKMFWQFILLSFSSLASTSFQLLKCVHLHPKESFNRFSLSDWRFADDASYECFKGNHLPWGIVAVVIVAIFCIPLPLSLPFLRRYHLLVPFSDIYSSLYKDNRRWWCAVDLLRRLLLATVYTFVDDPDEMHTAMASISVVLLFLQATARPYASSKANVVEAGLLMSLSIMTFLSDPNLTRSHAIAIETIFFVTTALLVAHIVWEDGKLKNWRKKPKPSPGYAIPALGEKDDGTMLRDLLLAEDVPDIVQSQEWGRTPCCWHFFCFNYFSSLCSSFFFLFMHYTHCQFCLLCIFQMVYAGSDWQFLQCWYIFPAYLQFSMILLVLCIFLTLFGSSVLWPTCGQVYLRTRRCATP